MRKANKIRHWAVLAVLVGAVLLIAACDQGTTSTLPSQPAARNFENPQTSIVVAAFDCTNVSTDGLTIIFVNNSTGAIDAYTWTFGDGTGSNAVNPVHTYESVAEYLVTLTVSNEISSDTLAQFCGSDPAPEPEPEPDP